MAGNSSVVGLETITFTDNMSFDGTERGGAMTTNGQMWIGSTALPHVKLGNITSPNNTIAIGYSSPNITLDLAGGGLGVDSFTPDSGTSPVVPNAGGNVTMAGSGSLTTVGGLNTLTTQLTGLTNHAVLIGAGTATITKVGPVASTGAMLQSNGVGSDPGFSTSTWPATTTINQLLYSSAANTVAGLATANSGVLATSSTGVPSINTSIAISAAGEVTMVNQPAFLAYLPSPDLNVTGDTTIWKLGSTTALTEVFDQNSDFNTNGTLTAPVTARWMFTGSALTQGNTIATGFNCYFQTSNRNYINAFTKVASSIDESVTHAMVCDMDSGDTCIFNIQVSGEAGKTSDVYGSAGGAYTYFSGYQFA